MSTAQELRKKTQTYTKPVNPTSSRAYIKELVALTISNIAYQRSLFPESGFVDIVYAGVPCKVLRDKSECEEANSLIDWINKAFEAFEMGYLKEMILCLEPDTADHGEVIEAYKFLFNHKDEIIFSSGDSNGKCVNVEIKEKSEFSEMLKASKTIPEPDLNNMYENLKIYMRLSYYDQVTPPDYCPKGFHNTIVPLTFKHPTDKVSFSDVETNWHSVKIKTKLLKNPHPQQPVENMIENKLRNGEITNGQQSDSKKAICIPSSKSLKSPKGAQKPSEIQNPVVSCACGCNSESPGIIIKCSSCAVWQHGICYGLMADESAPKEFYCFLCSIVNEEKLCFDSSLTKLNDNDRKSLCVYRTVLAYCERNNRINLKSIANDLNLSENLLNKIIVKLEEDNVISMNRRGSYSFVRIVDINSLKNIVMPKYFSKTFPCIPKLF